MTYEYDHPTDVLNDLADQIFLNAANKGFHDTDNWKVYRKDSQGNEIDVTDTWSELQSAKRHMLFVGEVAESFEEIHSGQKPSSVYYAGEKPEGVPIELADVLIRVLDYAASEGINIGEAVREKMQYNSTRQRLHGKRF